MTSTLPPGLYDLLQTPQLKRQLEASGLMDSAVWTNVDPAELPDKRVVHLAKELASYLAETVFAKKDSRLWQGALELAIGSPEFLQSFLPTILPEDHKALQRIKPVSISAEVSSRPDTPLGVSALWTGASRSPARRTQIQKELESCDRADWLV